MKRLCLLAALFMFALSAGPAGAAAEVYKWVDEKGVTNYGSAPPAQARAQALDPQASRVSVYSPPSGESRDLERAMHARIARLEQQLLLERRDRDARSAALRADSERRQLAYEQCQRDRRLDCDGVRDGYSYAAPVLYVGAPLLGPVRTAILRPGVGNFPTLAGYTPFPLPGMHPREASHRRR